MKTDLSPAQERERRISQRERLAAEAALLLALRGTVRKAVGLVTLEWADRRAESARVLALRRAVAGLETDLRRDVESGIADTRRMARGRLMAETALVYATLRAGGPVVALRPLEAVSAMAVGDELRATAAASPLASYIGTFGLTAMRGKLKMSDATKSAEKRMQRIASTEVGRAYNDEHRIETKAIAASIRGRSFSHILMRRWDAEIDACEHCWPHDGETVRLDGSFSGGDDPGDMHPNCRCAETLITVSREEYEAA